MSRRPLIHIALVVALAVANVLQAAAADRAGHSPASAATATIAVAAPSIPHAFAPRLNGGDQTWVPGHALMDAAPASAFLSASRSDRGRAARATRLGFFRRAPAGCRPPPLR